VSSIESLPPDQRAAVQLLLKQGQSYDQLADLLRIDPGAVRERAHKALDSLGSGVDAGLSASDRASVADYLLGQQGVAARATTRDLLGSDPTAAGWAQTVADQLEQLAPDTLPELPPAPAGAAVAAEPATPVVPAPVPAPPEETEAQVTERHPLLAADRAAMAAARTGMTDAPSRRQQPAEEGTEFEPEPAGFEREPPSTSRAPASRIGGALLLGGIAIVVAVILILVIGGGNDKSGGSSGGTLARSTPTQTSTTAGNTPVAQINLFSPDGRQTTVGLAQVFVKGTQRAIVVAGQGLPQGTYALWLQGTPGAKLLGFVPARVGANGRFATQGTLPKDASRYSSLIVTRENVQPNQTKLPTKPGTIALRGTLKLG
jgi:hypothetical protein